MHRNDMLDAIAKTGKTTQQQAEKILAYYMKIKAVTVTPHEGFQVKHGAFFDRVVIERALAEVR